MMTGTMPATAPHRASIAQARPALRRVIMVATTMPSTASKDAQASQFGGEENAYTELAMWYQCHGPPSRPGSRVRCTSPQEKVPTARAELGAPGWTVEDRRARPSTRP